MTSATLRAARAYTTRGWPVFPCQPGRKIPATGHGFYDATTDPAQITRWFTRQPDANLAIATGAPGPDVLDIDQHGPAGNGFAAYASLQHVGLLDGAILHVATPSGGLHAYFTGSAQRNGHLAAHHVDFRSAGGYVLAPPSQINGQPYRLLHRTAGHAHLDWDAVRQTLQPDRQLPPPGPRQHHDGDLDVLARWVAVQPEGNRNAGLFWAAHRALDTNPAADLTPLADAARQAGLPGPEITRTLNSARRPHQPTPPDHQPEAAS
jgi:Bifunctional DNA primase/polymerase, N-terminal